MRGAGADCHQTFSLEVRRGRCWRVPSPVRRAGCALFGFGSVLDGAGTAQPPIRSEGGRGARVLAGRVATPPLPIRGRVHACP